MLAVSEQTQSRIADQRPRRAVRVPADLGVPASSLLDVIIRAGSDPSFDVEKFERLVAIQQNEQDRQEKRDDRAAELAAEAAFNAAMTEVQRQMGRIATDAANTSTRSRYATYAALDRILRPLYTKAGFNISFNEAVGTVGAEMVRAIAYVTHVAPGAKRSHTRTYHTDIPADGKGAKGGDVMTKTHAHVSATSYGKRCLLGMVFNIATGNDDDGNAASANRPVADDVAQMEGTINAAQVAEISRLLEDRGISQRAFLQFIQLPSLEHIGADKFDKAVAKIKSLGVKS
jgi:ERF superfamily protein